MLFAQQTQLFFQLIRDTELASYLFEARCRPQLFVMQLKDDEYCRFSIEQLEVGLYLVSSAPAVHRPRESQFVPGFEAALPVFERWLKALKQHGTTTRVPDVPHAGLRECLTPLSLAPNEFLTEDEYEGLALLMSMALDITDELEPTHAARLRHDAEALFAEAYNYPRQHWLYMLVGFLRSHAALNLPLHFDYLQLSQIVIDRLEWPPPPPEQE